MQLDFAGLAGKYKRALLDDVVPFWLRHSLDEEQGGYFTCLLRDGEVYDTDKFVWLQARQAWQFAALHNRLEKREEWLRASKLGIDFLRKHGRDPEGHWYFSLRRDGAPTVEAYNIFSDCFAAQAFAQYARAAGDGEAGEIALATYRNIQKRKANPKRHFSKAAGGAPATVSLAMPMIIVNLTQEMGELLPEGEREQVLEESLAQILEVNLDSRRGIFFENVAPDGSHPDCFYGRLLCPGHGIECCWFLMDLARRRDDRGLAARAAEIALNTLRLGWDPGHGGIFYFMDAEGHPPDHLDWDQKLWWAHLEALVAFAMGYALTGEQRCLEAYGQVHDWAWARFPDAEHGEWWGYLNRRGELLLESKGGKWKGCFHVPRALWLCWQEFEALAST
jgi:N-acylglucosamine 2-epimerase